MNQAAAQALQQYAQVGTQTGVDFASPHRLIQMLMEGGMAKLTTALLHMERNELASKGECIGLAISIISGLQASLDSGKGGAVATNLDRLYDYMVRTLVTANLENDVAKVRHVLELLAEVKTGWDAIGGDLAAAAAG